MEVFSIFINESVACKSLCTNVCKIGIGGDTNPSHRGPYASVVSQHLQQQQQWLLYLCAEWAHFLRLLPSQNKQAKWCCEWLLVSKDLSGSLIFSGDLVQQCNLAIAWFHTVHFIGKIKWNFVAWIHHIICPPLKVLH